MASSAATMRDTTTVLLALAILTLTAPLFALVACVLPWLSRSCFSAVWFLCDDHFDFDWSSDFQLPSPGFRPAEKLQEAPAYYRRGRVVRHDSSRRGQEADCCFCLCRVEDGDEVRELRCAHVFHRACLDRWVDVGRVHCPLCRRRLAPGPKAAGAADCEPMALSGLGIGWWLS